MLLTSSRYLGKGAFSCKFKELGHCGAVVGRENSHSLDRGFESARGHGISAPQRMGVRLAPGAAPQSRKTLHWTKSHKDNSINVNVRHVHNQFLGNFIHKVTKNIFQHHCQN